jgi:arylsulfatase A
MISRLLLPCAALLMNLTAATSMAAHSPPPNIILIMADDMGYECIAANGCEEYKTPVIDGLAANGIRFTQCFSNPLCTPSRVKIMTGQYNVRNYVRFGVLERSQTTFAHQLKKAGYVTAIAGKWQLGKEPGSPQHFGFDESCLWQHTRGRARDGGCDSRYPNPQLEVNGKPVDYNNGEYGPDICADFLCEFIKKNRNRPFLVYYPMILTHCPFDATPDSTDWDPKSKGSKSYKGPGGKEDMKRHFKDMVEYADKKVGRLIETLEANGLREKTLVIFTGDNGTDKPIVTRWNGRDVTGGKGQVSDTGARVPFVANWPGRIKPCVDRKQLVEFADILPTLCEVSGAPLPQGYPGDGVSLWPTLSGKGQRTKNNIYIWYKGQAWARTVDYGVLLQISKNMYTYQKFDDHFAVKTVAVESAGAEAGATLRRLKGVIDDLAKTRQGDSSGGSSGGKRKRRRK